MNVLMLSGDSFIRSKYTLCAKLIPSRRPRESKFLSDSNFMETKVHHHIHNSQSENQINPFHALPSHLYTIRCNFNLPSSPKTSKCSHSLKLPHQTPCNAVLPNLYSIEKSLKQLFPIPMNPCLQ